MNRLSIDVEEYFMSPLLRIDKRFWPSLIDRTVERTNFVLDILELYDIKCTFFVVGYIALKYPSLVKKISNQGHEIASHSMYHLNQSTLSTRQLYLDLFQSKCCLEDCIGKEVIGFRAPFFSLDHSDVKSLDTLLKCGYKYDSSYFPIRRKKSKYLIPKSNAHIYKDLKIYELRPAKYYKLRLPYGGGYFRLYPQKMIQELALQNLDLYLHPWEFEESDSIKPDGILNRFRHLYGRGNKLIQKFHLIAPFILKNSKYSDICDTLQ